MIEFGDFYLSGGDHLHGENQRVRRQRYGAATEATKWS